LYRNQYSKRTTIIAHKSATFGGKAAAMSDGFASDMSTIEMESITPFPDDYWCHLDENMESGNIMIFIVSWLMLQKILVVQQIQICYVWQLPIMILLVLIAIVQI